MRAVQGTDQGSATAARCASGVAGDFKVEVRLPQGSSLRPFRFACQSRRTYPQTKAFAGDTVICSESKEQVGRSLEGRGMASGGATRGRAD